MILKYFLVEYKFYSDTDESGLILTNSKFDSNCLTVDWLIKNFDNSYKNLYLVTELVDPDLIDKYKKAWNFTDDDLIYNDDNWFLCLTSERY